MTEEVLELSATAKFITEAHERAEAADAIVPDDATCYLCLEGPEDSEEPLFRCCACRGSMGYAHVACLIDSAKADETGDRWEKCPTCHQFFYWNRRPRIVPDIEQTSQGRSISSLHLKETCRHSTSYYQASNGKR